MVSSAATRARPRSAASRNTSPGTSAAGAQADARGRGRLRPSLLNQAPARKRSSPPGAQTQALLLLPSTRLSRLKIGQLDLVRASEVQGQTSFSPRHAGQQFLPFRPLGGGQDRIAMDDRPGQNPHFAGAAASRASAAMIAAALLATASASARTSIFTCVPPLSISRSPWG